MLQSGHWLRLHLWTHDDRVSQRPLLVQPDLLQSKQMTSSLNGADLLVEISQSPPEQTNSENFHHRGRLILEACPVPAEMAAKQPQLQVSVHQMVAQQFQLSSRQEVWVGRGHVTPVDITADYVELSIRDQYIGRGDMYRLKNSLVHSCIYVGQKITFAGCIRAQIKEIHVGGKRVLCGFVTANTRTIFRSESAKYFLFLQVSQEMFECDDALQSGDLYFDKAVYGFLPELFRRWKQLGTNHVVSVVLFARVLYSTDEYRRLQMDQDPSVQWNTDWHAFYKDFYKVVCDWETRGDWLTALPAIKEESMRFRRAVLEYHSHDPSERHTPISLLAGRLSTAQMGNMLESVNLALNLFDRHYIDRDLLRTGLSIVIISAGTGVYYANKLLLRLTCERMIEDGIGLDLVCLTQPPLHSVPLFWFNPACGASMDSPPLTTAHFNAVPSTISRRIVMGSSNSYDQSSSTTPPHQRKMADFGISMVGGAATISSQTAIDPLYADTLNQVDGDERARVTDRCYMIPHWIDISYYCSLLPLHGQNYIPRCRMPNADLIMGNILESSTKDMFVNRLIGRPLTVGVPFLDEDKENQQDDLHDPGLENSPKTSKSASTNSIHGKNAQKGFVVDSLTMTSEPTSDLQAAKTSVLKQQSSVDTLGVKPTSLLSQILHADQGNKTELSNQAAAISPSSSPLRSRPPFSGQNASSRRFVVGSLPNEKHNSSLLVSESSDSEDGRPPIISSYTTRPISIQSRESIMQATNPQSSPRRSSLVYKLGLSPLKSQGALTDRDNPSGGRGVVSGTVISSHSHRSNTARIGTVNPCNPSKNFETLNMHLRRWQHVFPKIDEPQKPTLVKWKSLLTPACFPLTTDYLPTIEELTESFQEYTYTVSVNEDEIPTENLLLELISQRLMQGFQIVVQAQGSEESHSLNQSSSGSSRFGKHLAPGRSPFMGPSMTMTQITATDELSLRLPSSALDFTRFLTKGNQIHRFSFDESGGNVEVKRYVKKIQYKTDKIPYVCVLWPRHQSNFCLRRVLFSYPSSIFYNWNYLDQLIAGYQEELTEALKFWRTRFILLPIDMLSPATVSYLNPTNEPLTDEELRLAGFMKFIEVFHRSRYLPPGEVATDTVRRKGAFAGSSIPIVYTTFSASKYVENELSTQVQKARTPQETESGTGRRASVSEGLTKEMKFNVIAQAMQHTLYGLNIKDRRWHLRLYENVFIGSECVDWMIRLFSDINTRDEAVSFGNHLLQSGFLDHVNRKHQFLDGHYFYRISRDFMLKTSKEQPKEEKTGQQQPLRQWFRGGLKSALSTEDTESTPTSDGKPFVVSNSSFINSVSDYVKVELSKSILIDLDVQKRSYRKEVAVLHYDATHNPINCFHFQLHWLLCTSRLVEDLLHSWSRAAERCGMKLIEAPVEQVRADNENENPFQALIDIPLCVLPPTNVDRSQMHVQSVEIPEGYFETELLKHFGFLLDVEADSRFPSDKIKFSYIRPKYQYTQFVHRTGVAFVQLREPGKGFLWVNNRLLMSRSQQPIGKALSHANITNLAVINSADTIRKDLTAFCQNPSELSKFWKETADQLYTATGISAILDDVVDEIAKTEQRLIFNRDSPQYLSPASHLSPGVPSESLSTVSAANSDQNTRPRADSQESLRSQQSSTSSAEVGGSRQMLNLRIPSFSFFDRAAAEQQGSSNQLSNAVDRGSLSATPVIGPVRTATPPISQRLRAQSVSSTTVIQTQVTTVSQRSHLHSSRDVLDKQQNSPSVPLSRPATPSIIVRQENSNAQDEKLTDPQSGDPAGRHQRSKTDGEFS